MKRQVLVVALCVFVLGSETMAGKKAKIEDTNAVESVAGTGNLSKQHRDDLVRKLGAIKSFLEASKEADTNAVQLLRFAAEVEKEVRTKKYGLVFEEHKERVDVELEHNLPVLTEDKKRFIDHGGEVNFLIEGDNLAALKLLEKTHRGRIDLIYIDPPYNTGNKDFVYNDSYVDANDTFRHSKWLSFMKKRLEIARRLMSDDGVIFISIDDNEQAALKLLSDTIFGAENFLACICVKGNPRGRQSSSYFAQVHDSLIVYRKSEKTILDGFEISDEEKCKRFNKIDSNGVAYEEWELRKRGADARKEDSPNLHYPIFYNPLTKKISLETTGCNEIVILPKLSNGADGRWRWSKKKLLDNIEKVYVRQTKGGMWNIYERKYMEEKSKQLPPTIWDYPDVNTELGTKALKSLVGECGFDFPKPVGLIERITSLLPTNKSIVLDFFAGSGTTGHAVMNLNAKDGGKRKFILVTNNENGICEKVTYERLKRVIEKEDYAARLKYFKIGYVPIDEKVYYEYANDLLKHIRELVELENAVDFSKDKTVAIALTDKELEKFVGNDKRLDACKAVYVGHDVLISNAIKATLKKHGVKVNIIPQYYYPELEG